MNISIGTASIPIGSGFAVFPGFFQILFFHDFLTFDHASTAVSTFFLALFAGSATAGTILVVLDLCTDDLFLHNRFRRGAKTETF